jgi:phosphate acyltransferase
MSESLSATPRLAVDAMGSDLGPGEVVAGVALAIQRVPGLEPIILVGQRAVLEPLLVQHGLDNHPGVSICHASEVIEMSDKPLQALKRKKDASMFRAVELVKSGEAKGVVSCGNTGALMAAGTIKLRPLEGVERPALASVWPSRTGHFVLIDAGANPESTPEHMLHNAVLGSNYCQVALGIASPRVGLLTIGTEEGKGNELTKETHELLKRAGPLINYVGPIEGYQVFDNVVDVVVCDGFTGNVLLKTCQSLFRLVRDVLKEELTRSFQRKVGALLARGAFTEMKSRLSPERYGGAPLLGLRGNVLKAHGSSNREAIMNAIRIAHEVVSQNLTCRIEADIAKVNESVRQPV